MIARSARQSLLKYGQGEVINPTVASFCSECATHLRCGVAAKLLAEKPHEQICQPS
jgi:hypothetical protein